MKRLIALAAFATALASPAFAELKAGTKAPDFTAPAFLAGQPFTYKLSDALKKGPVVVYFFPAAYTKGCQIETHLFSEATDQFKAQKATVIGITAGNTEKLAEFSKDTEYCAGKFPMAVDAGAVIAKEYDATLPTRNISSRTSYVIGKNGVVASAYSAMDPTDHVNQTLTALKTLNGKK
jgi:thioredoxin-dependent peroxiredoxin